MRRLNRLLLCLALLTSASVHAADLAVYQGAGCTGVKKMDEFVSWFGRAPDRGIDFFAVDSWDGLIYSADWSIQCWEATKLPMTFSVPMLPKGTADTLADGAAGKFDARFRRIARALVNHGHRNAVVRIGWEFNGDWFPWAAQKDPQAWVAYWRRIATVMREEPGAAFRFEWCPMHSRQKTAPDSVYPGDDVVDIIGMDFYNDAWTRTLSPEQRWQYFLTTPYGLHWHRDFASAHNKPMSYPEWGTGLRPKLGGGGDDAYFVQKMAEWIRANNVVYHGYWDYVAPDFNARLSDGHQPAAGAAFLREFGSPRVAR